MNMLEIDERLRSLRFTFKRARNLFFLTIAESAADSEKKEKKIYEKSGARCIRDSCNRNRILRSTYEFSVSDLPNICRWRVKQTSNSPARIDGEASPGTTLSVTRLSRENKHHDSANRFRRYVVTNFTVTGCGNLFRVNALILLKPV